MTEIEVKNQNWFAPGFIKAYLVEKYDRNEIMEMTKGRKYFVGVGNSAVKISRKAFLEVIKENHKYFNVIFSITPITATIEKVEKK